MSIEIKIGLYMAFWITCGLYTSRIQIEVEGRSNVDWVTVLLNIIFGPIKTICYLLWWKFF